MTVEQDVACLQCGYNLRGLAADGRCPECGSEVGPTLEHHRRNPRRLRWLERVHTGARACEAVPGVWLVALGAVAGGLLIPSTLPMGRALSWWIAATSATVAVAGAIVAIAGAVYVTSPWPWPRDSEGWHTPRLLCRWALAEAGVLMLATVVLAEAVSGALVLAWLTKTALGVAALCYVWHVCAIVEALDGEVAAVWAKRSLRGTALGLSILEVSLALLAMAGLVPWQWGVGLAGVDNALAATVVLVVACAVSHRLRLLIEPQLAKERSRADDADETETATDSTGAGNL